jgi:lysozyme
MQATAQALDLIKGFESCRLEAYQDSIGVWTIGWGHTRGVKEGDTCTQEQADAWLLEDAQEAVDAVLRLVKVNLTGGQFAALVSFAFNLGQANFARSTLLKNLNHADFGLAANEFPKWSFAGGKHLDGLLRRRLAEQAVFQGQGAEMQA